MKVLLSPEKQSHAKNLDAREDLVQCLLRVPHALDEYICVQVSIRLRCRLLNCLMPLIKGGVVWVR